MTSASPLPAVCSGRVLVCVGCALKPDPNPQTAGQRLFVALKQALLEHPYAVQRVKCFGFCDVGQCCAVVLDAPGKDSVVVGALTPDNGVPIVQDFLAQHTTHHKGRVFGKRLQTGMKHYLARIPAKGRTP